MRVCFPVNKLLLRRGEAQEVFATGTDDGHAISRYVQRFCMQEGLQIEVFLLSLWPQAAHCGHRKILKAYLRVLSLVRGLIAIASAIAGYGMGAFIKG